MIFPDVNILVYAHRADMRQHKAILGWLEGALLSGRPVAVSDMVLSAFLRIVTNPKIFGRPSPLEDALRFAEQLRSQPGAVLVAPGAGHWRLFRDLCLATEVKGGMVPDAYIAALAIEHGAELVTNDRDFARFKGLKWSQPPKD